MGILSFTAVLGWMVFSSSAATREGVRTARVYELEDPDQRTAYIYETWTETEGDQKLRKAEYRRPEGSLALKEEYWTKGGSFVRYELSDLDRKRVTRVRVDGNKLHYELRETSELGEKVKTGSEDLEPLHALGPGLLDRLQSVWDQAVAGEKVELRLAVPDRFESFWFKFKKVAETETEVTFHLKPSSFMIAMFVQSIEFVFDKATRRLKTYRGPTFIHRLIKGEWQQLQVVMDYETGPAAVKCPPGRAQCSAKQP